MIGKIRYGNTTIQYRIIKSKRRKTSEIQIDQQGVVFRVPAQKSNEQIKRTIEQKKQWIYKKQLEFATRPAIVATRKYSQSFIVRRVKHYSEILQVRPARISFKKLRGRWGSMTSKNMLNLSEDLTKAPKSVIDYVVLHELCHNKIREHSFKFWELVGKYMPEYEKQKEWLEYNGKSIL